MTYQGIDVSRWNTVTDWSKVKASGKSFVFLRLGWINSDGSITKDDAFESFYKGAIDVGLNIGVYVFSYLKDAKYAATAAENTIKMIEDKTIFYPIAFDYEENKIAKTLTREQNTDICRKYLNAIQNKKYFAVMYTYTSFIQSYLNIADLSAYALWIADYREKSGTNCPYKGTWQIWQYLGDEGKCSGVVGACDCNVSKIDYATIIKKMRLNGYEGDTINTPTVAKNETIDNENKYGVPNNVALRTPMNKNIVTTFSYAKHKNTALSLHFKTSEFASISNDKLYSDKVKIHNKLIEILEALYAKLDCSKIIITSGYRTPEHDKAVGSNGNSQHCLGRAADIICYSKNGSIIPAKKVCCTLEDIGNVYGIGYINANAVHIDTRDKAKKWWGDETKAGQPNISRLGYGSFHDYFKM